MSRKLVKSTSVVMSMTMLSRIMGFLRDMVTAHVFGAGAAFDAFSVAFKIPNFMRRLFAEGSFSQAFVPVLSTYQKKSSPEETREFINTITGTLAATLLVVTLIGIIAAPYLVKLFAPGFASNGDRYDLAVSMLRITFPYLAFISLTALSGSILNTHSRYWVAAFTPIFLNIVMIAAALLGAKYWEMPIMALAWGVFVAGIVQMLFPLPFLKQLALFPRPRVSFQDPGVRRVLKLMVPALFGVSVGQVNLLVDTLFASLLAVGSVSWLYYSDRLMEFPLGVFGVAISTVILPHLSRHHAADSQHEFSMTLDWALRSVLLVGLPAGLCMMMMAGPMLSTLFQYGRFNAHSVQMASYSLTAFALGITPFMLVKILASGFYAKQDMRTPVRIGVIAMLTNIVLNVSLISWLAHAGIALATSLSAVVNSGCLFYLLYQRKIYQPSSGWRLFAMRLLIANSCLAVWLYCGAGQLSDWTSQSALWRLTHLLAVGSGAVLIYLAVLFICGMRLKDFVETPVIVPT